MDVKKLLNENLPRQYPRVVGQDSHLDQLDFHNSSYLQQQPITIHPSANRLVTPTLSSLSSIPPLSRDDSSDSISVQTPSPITPPSAGAERLPKPFHKPNHSIDAVARIAITDPYAEDLKPSMDFTQPPPGSAFSYPGIALPPHTTFDPSVLQAAPGLAQPQPIFDQQAQPLYSSTPVTATPQRTQKKNTYPCPLSKQYNCGEFFTTSGHAARHAKKHTGKKDAICPECGKGFTRKDNMEQHRRTHASGRNNNGGASSGSTNPVVPNDTSTSTNSSVKTLPKEASEESKARKKTHQQRKARPPSISTSAPIHMPMPHLTPQQPLTTATAMAPQVDLLDPALREHAGLFSPASDFNNNLAFPHMHQQQMPNLPPQYIPPHAPMHRHAASFGSSPGVMRTFPDPMVADQPMPMYPAHEGPTSPSLAPKLDALALAAEDVRNSMSDSSG